MYETDNAIASQLADFHAKYGIDVEVGLQLRIDEMRAAQAECQAQLDYVCESQERMEAQDRSLVTVRGLEHMAKLFGEQADRAGEALRAYEQLTEGLW